MILVLNADGTSTLELAYEFNRFHCEIDAAFSQLDAARQAWAGTVEIESRDIAWVDMEALWSLGRSSCGADADNWLAQAKDMVEKSARYGWVRPQPAAIKSHIVWRD